MELSYWSISYRYIFFFRLLLPRVHFSCGYELHVLKYQESDQKASEICPESEIESLGPWDGSTPEQLSAQITRMNQRLHRENQQCVF